MTDAEAGARLVLPLATWEIEAREQGQAREQGL